MTKTTKFLAFIGKHVLRMKPLTPLYEQRKKKCAESLFAEYGKGSPYVYKGAVKSVLQLFNENLRP